MLTAVFFFFQRALEELMDLEAWKEARYES